MLALSQQAEHQFWSEGGFSFSFEDPPERGHRRGESYSFRKTLGGRTIEEKIELGDLGDLEEHSCWEGERRTGPLVRLSCYARGELCPGRVRT